MSRLPHVAAAIQRTIYFHRVVREDLTTWPVPWARLMGILHRADRETREIETDAGAVIRLRVRSTVEPYHITLTTVRKTGLPKIEHDSGRIEFLTLAPDAGLGETTHVVVTDGVIVSEYNHYGPRVGSLLRFLLRGAQATEEPMANTRLGQLIKGNVFANLGDAGAEVTLVRLKVPTDLIRVVKEADEPFGVSVEAVSEVAPAEDVEIILRRTISKDQPNGLGVGLARFMRIAAALNPFRRRCKLSATFKTLGDRQAVVDLFGDPIEAHHPFPLVNDQNRVVTEAVAFAALTQAYRDLRAEIRHSRPV